MSDALSWHRLCLRSAQAGGLLFAWLLVFDYFSTDASLAKAVLYTAATYVLAYAVAFILTPFSARAVRNGVKLLAMKAVLLLALAYLALGGALWGALPNAVWGMAAFAILFGAYRALYWISYNAHMGSGGSRMAQNIVVAFVPLAFGYALAFAPHAALVPVAAAVLVALSFIPYIALPDAIERYPWTPSETFRQFLKPLYRRIIVRAAIDGAHATALFLLWPLAVFILLDRSYALVGLVFSLTLLAILVARLVFSRVAPRFPALHTPTVRAVHVVSAWVLRLASATPLGVVSAGALAHAYGSDREETDVFVFEYTADQGVYLDEHTALKEMGAALGRIAAVCAFAAFTLYVSIPVAFVAAFVLIGLLAAALFFIGRGSILY